MLTMLCLSALACGRPPKVQEPVPTESTPPACGLPFSGCERAWAAMREHQLDAAQTLFEHCRDVEEDPFAKYGLAILSGERALAAGAMEYSSIKRAALERLLEVSDETCAECTSMAERDLAILLLSSEPTDAKRGRALMLNACVRLTHANAIRAFPDALYPCELLDLSDSRAREEYRSFRKMMVSCVLSADFDASRQEMWRYGGIRANSGALVSASIATQGECANHINLSQDCTSAWSLMDSEPEESANLYNRCTARGDDGFAAYGLAVLKFRVSTSGESVYSFRSDLESALKIPIIQNCGLCITMIERDLGLSYLMMFPDNFVKGQTHLLSACKRRTRHYPPVSPMPDDIDPCAFLDLSNLTNRLTASDAGTTARICARAAINKSKWNYWRFGNP